MGNRPKWLEDHPWHALDAAEVTGRLDVSENGLEDAEAARRAEICGANALPQAPGTPGWLRFLRQFHNVLIYVLLAAAGVTALMQHWIDTGVILGVVVINALVGFIQEGKAERALEGIRRMLSLEARVVRDGKRRKINAESLVPGDLVELKSGDRVAADLRLVEVRDLKIEESPLTGESVPVEKHSSAVAADTELGDRTGMAYSGTLVTYGRARGHVVATGTRTELGKISGMMDAVSTPRTPLLKRLDEFGRLLSILILGLTVVFFLVGWLAHDFALDELFLAVIGLAVAAIPEGLPAILTITLALGVQRMASRNAIVRKLPSVETLGSVTVICSDKTGTLTHNEMTARNVRTREARYEVTGTGYAPVGEIQRDGSKISAEEEDALWQVVMGSGLCNDTEVEQAPDGEWRVQGEPTEAGLRVLALKAGFEHGGVPRVDVLPFESEHKYMATLNDHGGRTMLWVKGAPERILERCRAQWGSDGEEDLDHPFWETEIAALARTGQRVLAVAGRADAEAPLSHDSVRELVLFGIVGMIDPPREDAILAVRQCQEAGIRVKMITGDHVLTAAGIARELGIRNPGVPLTGRELEEMDEATLRRTAPDCDLYARTSPEHKLRLVRALQANGEVVAMTGDGVNDAPAIKSADVGIAMGVKGSQVTKDVSEMVLADDHFATIAHAVEEGRTIYDNLRKTLLFILPTNGAQGLVVGAAILFGLALPITPVQILWVNMVTAITLGLALAFEPTEPDTMRRPPRPPREPILGAYGLWRVAFVSFIIASAAFALHHMALAEGLAAAECRTIAVNALVFGQIFYLLNCRFIEAPSLRPGIFDNRVVPLAILLMLVLQAGFTFMPLLRGWFRTAPPPDARWWLWIVLTGFAVFVLVEIEKAVVRALRARSRGKDGEGEPR